MSLPISDEWFRRVKRATHHLVRECGGIVDAADIARVSKSAMGRWSGAGDPDIITWPAMLALEAFCGKPLVTVVLADLNGQRLVEHEDVCVVTIATHHAEAMRHAADLMATGAAALADGKITPTEAAQMDRAAGDLEARLMALRSKLAAVSPKGGV